MFNQKLDEKAVENVTVKLSGCPNSCGQHHIATIGFHGGGGAEIRVARRVRGRLESAVPDDPDVARRGGWIPIAVTAQDSIDTVQPFTR